MEVSDMELLLLRPYYGININSDMHGDLGVSDYLPHVFPDISFIQAATIANAAKNVNVTAIDANAEKWLSSVVMQKLGPHYDEIIVKVAAPTIKYDLEFANNLKKAYPNATLRIAGHAAKLLTPWIRKNIPAIHEVIQIPLEDYVQKRVHGENAVTHLDSYPTLDYRLMPIEKYKDVNGLLRASIYASRSCPVGCSYCPYVAFLGRKWEVRSLPKLIEDIEVLLDLGVRDIQFRDQYFSASKSRTKEFCQMILDKGLKFRWRCETVLNSLDKELIDLMVEAGMDMIFFGIESASPDTLTDLGRPSYDYDKMRDLIAYLNAKKVLTCAFYIIGFPTDNWTTAQRTFDLSLSMKTTYAKYSVFAEYPFASIEEAALTPEDFVPFSNTLTSNPCKQLSLQELEFLKDHFSILYQSQQDDIQIAYQYQHVHIKNFNNAVEELSKQMEAHFSSQLVMEEIA